MRIGLISDIHGNRHALEAVIADAPEIDRWWVLGDLVAIGPVPVGTLELIADLPQVEAVSGNTERYVLTSDRPAPTPGDVLANPALFELYGTIQRSFAWTGGALAAHGWGEWLSDLPLEVRTELPDGTAVLGVHASPGRDDGEGSHQIATKQRSGPTWRALGRTSCSRVTPTNPPTGSSQVCEQ